MNVASHVSLKKKKGSNQRKQRNRTSHSNEPGFTAADFKEQLSRLLFFFMTTRVKKKKTLPDSAAEH